MRSSLALAAILVGAAPAAALAAGDRYGVSAQAGAADRPSLLTRALGWANKQTPDERGEAPMVLVQPEPMALAGQFLRGRGPAAQTADPAAALRPSPSDRTGVAYSPTYASFVPQAPYRPTAARAAPATVPETPAAGALPTSLYSPPPQAAVGLPQRLADATPAVRAGGEPARLYSVHRGYGLTPDAIPETAQGQGYVLIGPSGGGVASAPSDDSEPRDDASDDDNARKGDRPF